MTTAGLWTYGDWRRGHRLHCSSQQWMFLTSYVCVHTPQLQIDKVSRKVRWVVNFMVLSQGGKNFTVINPFSALTMLVG